jgi:hypothetical protein
MPTQLLNTWKEANFLLTIYFFAHWFTAMGPSQRMMHQANDFSGSRTFIICNMLTPIHAQAHNVLIADGKEMSLAPGDILNAFLGCKFAA